MGKSQGLPLEHFGRGSAVRTVCGTEPAATFGVLQTNNEFSNSNPNHEVMSSHSQSHITGIMLPYDRRHVFKKEKKPRTGDTSSLITPEGGYGHPFAQGNPAPRGARFSRRQPPGIAPTWA